MYTYVRRKVRIRTILCANLGLRLRKHLTNQIARTWGTRRCEGGSLRILLRLCALSDERSSPGDIYIPRSGLYPEEATIFPRRLRKERERDEQNDGTPNGHAGGPRSCANLAEGQAVILAMQRGYCYSLEKCITALFVHLRSAQYHPRFVCAILGFLRKARIRGLRKTILGWSESELCA